MAAALVAWLTLRSSSKPPLPNYPFALQEALRMQGDTLGQANAKIDDDLAQLLQGMNGTPMNRSLDDDVVPAVLTAVFIILMSLIPILRPFLSFVNQSQAVSRPVAKSSNYLQPRLDWLDSNKNPFVFTIALFSDGSEDDRDYDRRFGIWRILRIFKDLNLPATVVVSCSDLQDSPDLIQELKAGDFEACMLVDCSQSHRSWSLAQVIDKCGRDMARFEEVLGQQPKGLYLRSCDLKSRRAVHERFKFEYDANGYGDSPWWAPHLVVPNSAQCLDMSDANSTLSFNDMVQMHAKDHGCLRKLTSMELPCSVFGKVPKSAQLYIALQGLKNSPG
eukprot:219879-Hanusia_phi.AAC.1